MGKHDDRVTARLYETAADVGRLRARLDPEPGSLLEYTLDRLASHVETLLGFFEPTAAQLVACTHPGDDATIRAALEHVDARHDKLRRTLGYRKAA